MGISHMQIYGIYCDTRVLTDLPQGVVTQEEGWHFKYGKKTRRARSLPTHGEASAAFYHGPPSEQLHHDMRLAAHTQHLKSRVEEVLPER